MIVYKIPVTDSPDQQSYMTLSGAPYTLFLVWNILGYWALSISDAEGARILSGIKVVLQIDFFKDHPDLGLPNGALYAVDWSNRETDIGRYDFVNDRKIELLYMSAE
jgi:hypothetical protein